MSLRHYSRQSEPVPAAGIFARSMAKNITTQVIRVGPTTDSLELMRSIYDRVERLR